MKRIRSPDNQVISRSTLSRRLNILVEAGRVEKIEKKGTVGSRTGYVMYFKLKEE
jgi:DNA-binding HxlR family transcriptional regulator